MAQKFGFAEITLPEFFRNGFSRIKIHAKIYLRQIQDKIVDLN